MGIHSPWVSHLLFADDCIVFSEASQQGADRLKEILNIYSKGSGQLVNREKSAVFSVPIVMMTVSKMLDQA